MHKAMPKAFIFDLDGVITDTAKYHYLAWKQLAEALNLSFNEKDNEKLKGVSRTRSFEIILEINSAVGKFSAEQIEYYANSKNDKYVELIKCVTPADILPGIQALLLKARQNGIKCAVASASRNAFSVLQSLELIDAFDYVADASKIKNTKPHPEVFINCAQSININERDCIGFEDAQAGIEAIKAANMFSVGINVEVTGTKPDFSINATSELDFDKICAEFLKFCA